MKLSVGSGIGSTFWRVRWRKIAHTSPGPSTGNDVVGSTVHGWALGCGMVVGTLLHVIELNTQRSVLNRNITMSLHQLSDVFRGPYIMVGSERALPWITGMLALRVHDLVGISSVEAIEMRFCVARGRREVVRVWSVERRNRHVCWVGCLSSGNHITGNGTEHGSIVSWLCAIEAGCMKQCADCLTGILVRMRNLAQSWGYWWARGLVRALRAGVRMRRSSVLVLRQCIGGRVWCLQTHCLRLLWEGVKETLRRLQRRKAVRRWTVRTDFSAPMSRRRLGILIGRGTFLSVLWEVDIL